MKPRTPQKQTKKVSWKPEYSTKGDMEFTVRGYVQDIYSAEERDYCTFNIDNPYVPDNVNTITVECAWSLPQLEKGDHVEIRGNIRSWWKKDLEIVTHAFVAEEIEEIADKSKKRLRFGTEEHENNEKPF